MTTSQSPLRALKQQAGYIAKTLKAFERGEKIDHAFAAKLEEARHNPSLKFAVAMDDKTLVIEMPWEQIRATSEVGLSEFILREMRGRRETAQ
ncbi:MAG: hypothetical protein AAFY12_12255 [Pseudomonadota bacterium]